MGVVSSVSVFTVEVFPDPSPEENRLQSCGEGSGNTSTVNTDTDETTTTAEVEESNDNVTVGSSSSNKTSTLIIDSDRIDQNDQQTVKSDAERLLIQAFNIENPFQRKIMDSVIQQKMITMTLNKGEKVNLECIDDINT